MTKTVKDWQIDESWTLFLDRDGVINERNFDGYIISPDHFQFNNDVLDALSILDKVFGKKILVTNQQGVAKGIMSERNLNEVHRYMSQVLKTKIDFEFDAIYTATNFRGTENDRRKPNSAMANEAKELFPVINFAKSVMIGDTDSDIKFGTKLGMKTVLVNSSELVSERPDVAVDSLKEFALLL
jgi:D-glycero-D-manno-heptose 1,7-bisphosphate phosphatase